MSFIRQHARAFFLTELVAGMWLTLRYMFKAKTVSYTHLTLPTNREV